MKEVGQERSKAKNAYLSASPPMNKIQIHLFAEVMEDVDVCTLIRNDIRIDKQMEKRRRKKSESEEWEQENAPLDLPFRLSTILIISFFPLL